jgi:K(+)-stimulated pyrophosphate-energized sodium pump
VGDNVGDCAGMAADLFETYAVTIVATMVLSSIFFVGDLNMMIYPLSIGAACLLTSILGTFFVKLGNTKNVMNALYKGFVVSAVASLVILWPVTDHVIGFANEYTVNGKTFNGQPVLLRSNWFSNYRIINLDNRILHRN